MNSPELLQSYFRRLDTCATSRWHGRVTKVIGSLVESEGPFCSVGEACEIVGQEAHAYPGEIIGFRGSTVLSMALEPPWTIHYGDRVTCWGTRPSLRVGEGLLGRVIDSVGNPLDGANGYIATEYWPVDASAPAPLDRQTIQKPLGCGVRAIDAFTTCGYGQRVAVFGGSGVGKSTLIGMLSRGTSADVTIVALVGERGREVRDFLENALGTEGRKRSVVVVSTSDQSPLLRIRAALAATAIAEYFCAKNKHVLLVIDSLTRFAMAQREIGLAAGEPPTAKGYTPSVFTLLARLVERAGYFGHGSITGFYSVLMEGDDQQDPLVDAIRSLVDGHIVLDRRLALQNQYPPIAILDSLSRLMSGLVSPEHHAKAHQLRRMLATYARSEDLIRVGAYQKGADPLLDKAICVVPKINEFLQQQAEAKSTFEDTISALLSLEN